MLRFSSRKHFALTTSAAVVCAVALPLAAGATANAQAPHRAAHVAADAQRLHYSGKKSVIVYLRRAGMHQASDRARFAAARKSQAPVRAELRRDGATHVKSLVGLNAMVARVSGAAARQVARNPRVKHVVPDGTIRLPARSVTKEVTPRHASLKPNATPATAPCGTAASPELDPEALNVIHATPNELGNDIGKGVHVAYIADGIDPSIPDFQRNPDFASTDSPAGSPVVTQKDFTGDPITDPTPGGEAFIDAGSVVAQGNQTYDLKDYVADSNPLPAGCDIKIVGAAPGATVTGLKVFSEDYATTTSNFVEAINFAVENGVKVLNESFDSRAMPQTEQDAVYQADDAAVAAGVTVVVSTGDAGITNTIGSPATDPKVISVAGSTTYREYEQDMYGGTNVPEANGDWLNNNISGLSSGGFATQNGNTADILAPGDLNWGVCSTNTDLFFDCTNDKGEPSPIEVAGGTSESTPLTSAAAADVIAAYESTHNGDDPSPALVKQILTSTAKDVDAPAIQAGAGLLNVAAAVAAAKSAPGTTASPTANVLVSPTQINTEQKPKSTVTKKITVTNNGPAAETVHLSTRSLTDQLASQSDSFCMQPGTPTPSCPANTGTFVRETGATQVYQAEHFNVPTSTGDEPTRLVFHTAYPFKGQTSVLKVALLDPDGTYASYSEPQGLGDYADNEVANPKPGTWTAIFFTTKTDPDNGAFGTQGLIRWNASTYQYAPADTISPDTLDVPAGGSQTAKLTIKSPVKSGDSWESVVVSTPENTTTIPVTVRTLVGVGPDGGHFFGVLTGGNGRDCCSQDDVYDFTVHDGVPAVHTTFSFRDDPGDTVYAGLIDPNGQLVALNTNDTASNFGDFAATRSLDLFAANPLPGRWQVFLRFLEPVTGHELKEPYKGSILESAPAVTSNLPHGKAKLKGGKAHTFTINVANNGISPQSYFVDPRKKGSKAMELPNFDQTEDGTVPLPLAADFSTEPLYLVPPHTSQLQATVNADRPVTFDMYPIGFNPDVSPDVTMPGVTGSHGTNSASLTYTEPQITPGVWFLDPSEIGPYPDSGAPTGSATVSLTGKVQKFDPSVDSQTGDFWENVEGLSSNYDPRYVPQGDSTSITVTIKPSAAVGKKVHGVVYVDAEALGAPNQPSANEVVALPYKYRVK